MNRKLLLVASLVILLVAVGASAFYAGTVYAQSQAQNATANFFRQRAADQNGAQTGGGPCGFGAGGVFSGGGSANGGTPTGGNAGRQGGQNAQQFGRCVARGQIKSVDGNTVQITTADSVITIKVADKTIISKTDQGTLADLKPGDRVTVFSPDSGDSPTASMIQLQRGLTPQQ